MNLTAVKILLLLSFLTFSNSATSEEEQLYKVEEFVFLGVSLDENAEDVINGFSEYFSIKPEELTLQTNFSGSVIEYIDYEVEGIDVSTYLEGKIEDENVLDLLLVRMITDDFDSFIKDAIEQYGPPTIVNNDQRYHWCEMLNETKDGCAFNFGKLSISYRKSNQQISASLWKIFIL